MENTPVTTVSAARVQILRPIFEQYRIEPNIATSRYWIHLAGEPEKFQTQIASKRAPGHRAVPLIWCKVREWRGDLIPWTKSRD